MVQQDYIQIVEGIQEHSSIIKDHNHHHGYQIEIDLGSLQML
jgi:hypothetical protein